MTSRAASRHAASRSRRSLLQRTPAIIVIVFSMVVSLLAIISRGVETTEINVDDGGIWVTNESKLMVGHMNYDARILDAAFLTQSTDFDIGQAEDTVTFSDFTSRSIAPVDVSSVALGAATSLPESAVAMQGGPAIGVIDPTEGNVWLSDATAPSSTAYTQETALKSGLEDGAVATSINGTLYALSAIAGELFTAQRTGSVIETHQTPVPGLSHTAELSLTVVGEQAVGLDSTSNTLVLPNGKLYDLSAEGISQGVVLQQPGPASDDVLLATTSALFAVPLKGGQAKVLGSPMSSQARQLPRFATIAAPTRPGRCREPTCGSVTMPR